VFDRWRADKAYRPSGLDAWAKRKSVDPDKITSSVRADNPTVAVTD
jgi:hypothetical protein